MRTRPNHALQRTAPGVTAPASAAALPHTAQVPRNAPLSLYANKRTVQAVLADRADRDIAALNAAMAACFDSADYQEGRSAFMAKRKPVFQGR